MITYFDYSTSANNEYNSFQVIEKPREAREVSPTDSNTTTSKSCSPPRDVESESDAETVYARLKVRESIGPLVLYCRVLVYTCIILCISCVQCIR